MWGMMDMSIEENEAEWERTIDVLCWKGSGEAETAWQAPPTTPQCRDWPGLCWPTKREGDAKYISA